MKNSFFGGYFDKIKKKIVTFLMISSNLMTFDKLILLKIYCHVFRGSSADIYFKLRDLGGGGGRTKTNLNFSSPKFRMSLQALTSKNFLYILMC